MLRVVVPIIVLVVFVYGLIDLIRTDARQTKGISKPAWFVVQILLPVIGAILWFLIGRPRDGGAEATPATYRHPTAPDDDPDFLHNLEQRRRNQAEAARLKKLQDELDAKERGLRNGTDDSRSPDSGGTHGSGDSAQGTDEVK
ncbi:PLD nuclease N-terminal domain-containing protein [Arthrobacter sp. UYEF3]|uniref:PLD nuclease N-terminal domain-containing protein n=1 Tax=Arthrobacter sp. UYEF3 TaxID=1756365 RepID=UPI0033916C86